MKKLLLVLVFIAGGILATNAQERAIGLRGGYGWELSFQTPVNANRLELDLGLYGGGNGFNLSGIYQWVNPINGFPEGFNWYAGVGAEVGVWTASYSYYDGTSMKEKRNSDLCFGIDGQLGIEYNFADMPLAVSIDWKPSIGFAPGVDNYSAFRYSGFAGAIRYRF